MSSVSFELSPELTNWAAALQDWSVAEIRPHARAADTNKRPPEHWEQILRSSPVPLGLPGQGDVLSTFPDGSWVAKLSLYESLCYGDIWALPMFGPGIGHLVVDAMGSQEQIDKWYLPALQGKYVTGFGLTEPGFGSDTSMVSTTATRDGNEWVINGSKIYCTNGFKSDWITVFATTDKSLGAAGIACFIVEKDRAGFSVPKPNESKLGIRSWLTSELLFEDCRIPLENRLGWNAEGPVEQRASGRGGALAALSNNRPAMSAMAIGMAQASLDITTEILRGQRAGFSVQRWQDITTDLERMTAALQRARRVNRKAAFGIDQADGNRAFPALAKVYGPQTSERVIRRCMQLLGPEGTSEELLLEKWYRDVKITDIFEGSGQVQRIILARELVGRLAG